MVGQQVIREFVCSLAAVCPEDGQLASLIMPTEDAEIMSVFLNHTAQLFEAEYCLMFLDCAGWHLANEYRIPKTIRLLPLPPYSPELNPVEGIWDHLRENYFGNKIMKNLKEVEDILCRALHHLMHGPELVKSMTNYHWIDSLCLKAN